MRAHLVAAMLAVLLAGASPPNVEGAARPIDVRHSKAAFTVTHVYVTAVTGSVPIANGEVELRAGTAIPTGVRATLDPRGTKSGDDERDADLQGPEWFDTKRFPQWTYVSTRVSPAGDGRFTVDGTLTVHGVPQRVPLAVTIVRGLPDPEYRAVGHADRHGFGMTVTRTDSLIGSDIALTLDIVLAH